jgi:chromosome segregation ATPase
MTNNNTNQENQYIEGTTPIEKEMDVWIEKEFGKDAWNPCYWNFSIEDIEKTYLAGRQQAQVEVDQWEYTYKAEIHRQNMMGEAINNHQREIQKLREQNNNLSNSYDDLWAKCADESYWIEENKKLREQNEKLKTRVKELGFNNDYVEEVEDKNWNLGQEIEKLKDHLKRKDEMYKKAFIMDQVKTDEIQELKQELQKECECVNKVSFVMNGDKSFKPFGAHRVQLLEWIDFHSKLARETIKNRKVL